MKYIVYCTMNIINGKIYIGVHGTENPDIFDGYIGNSINIFKSNTVLNHPKYPFHKAVKKYGYSAFKRSILKVFDSELDALDLEAWLVTEEFIKKDTNYNAVVGGSIPPKADKPIYQYNLNGEYIKEYKSLKEAAKQFNSTGNIIGIAALYKRTSFNFLWSVEKVDCLDITQYNIDKQACKTYLYDANNNLLKEFNTQTDCAKFLQTGQLNISKHIKSGKPFKGYIIKGETNNNSHRNVRKVAQYDLDGNLIKVFNTTREARAEFSNVNKVLRGLAKQCKGYTFKYYE